MERSIWENILHSFDSTDTAQSSPMTAEQKAAVARKNAELTKKLREANKIPEGELRWKAIKK